MGVAYVAFLQEDEAQHSVVPLEHLAYVNLLAAWEVVDRKDQELEVAR